MKALAKFLTLVLSFELMIGPLGNNLILPSEALAKECPAGMQYNSSLNRCLTKEGVIEVNKAVENCRSKGDAQAQRDCYKQSAEDALAAMKRDGEVGGKDSFFKNEDGELKGIVKAGNAAAIAIPLFLLTKTMIHRWSISKKDKYKSRSHFKCNPPSLVLMYSAAAALGAGEIISYATHSTKMNKLKKEWDKIATPDSEASVDTQRVQSTEAQSQAFEMLAQNEDQVAKTAKLKKGFYLAATSLFAAGTLAATFEQIQLGLAKKSLIKGKGMMAVPSTATAGAELVKKSTNTINRLTCHTTQKVKGKEKDKNGKEVEKEYDVSDEQVSAQEKLDQEKALQESAELAKQQNLNESNARQERMQSYEKNRKSLEDERAEVNLKLKNITDPVDRKNLESRVQNIDNQLNELEEQRVQDVLDEAEENQISCPSHQVPYQGKCINKPDTAMNFIWSENKLPQEIIALHNKELKKQAAYNISTARNASDLLNLTEELEAIELENYTRISYIDENLDSHLKNVSFTSEVANVIAQNFLINNSIAQENDLPPQEETKQDPPPAEETKEKSWVGNILGKVGGFLGGGLNKISGIIKFKNGVPVSREALKKIETEMGSSFSKAIYTPTTRIAINGVLGGWMGIMTSHMGKQAKLSTERAKKLREMKEEFNHQAGLLTCTDKDRNDPAKPSCYCYTPDNKRNSARANSKICNLAYTGISGNGDYLGGSDSPKVCVDQSFGIDASCSCRNRKGADGKNTCLKAGAGFSTSGFNPGSFSMLSAGMAPANDLFNGNTSGADITDGAGINAARIQKAADDLLAKNDPKAAKDASKIEPGLEKELMGPSQGMTMSNLGNNSSLPMSPQAAAAALEKELEKTDDTPVVQTAGGGGAVAPVPGPGEEQLEFGMTDEQFAIQETEVAEAMKQNLDYGGNDINNGSDTNIFEVLTNRYQRSGMRRLFDVEGKTTADKPAKTDINQ